MEIATMSAAAASAAMVVTVVVLNSTIVAATVVVSLSSRLGLLSLLFFDPLSDLLTSLCLFDFASRDLEFVAKFNEILAHESRTRVKLLAIAEFLDLLEANSHKVGRRALMNGGPNRSEHAADGFVIFFVQHHVARVGRERRDS
jgi:hypothetical protein